MSSSAADTPSRAPDLEISVMSDGYVVYDPRRDRVHYLNASSALILELCTGEMDAEQIAAAVQEAFDLAEPPTGEVATCLHTFRTEGLLID